MQDPNQGRVISVNVSDGGVPKRPVPSARVTPAGVEGDRQRDSSLHGGPDRAVSLFSWERIQALREEGHPIEAGSTGENLTLAGVNWGELGPGATLEIGDVLLQVTSYAAPCRKIAGSFRGGDFARISQKRHAGWSRLLARVLRPGIVAQDAPVRVGLG